MNWLSLRDNQSVEVQDCRIIIDHFKGCYIIYPNLRKGNQRMSTCNQLHLQTLRISTGYTQKSSQWLDWTWRGGVLLLFLPPLTYIHWGGYLKVASTRAPQWVPYLEARCQEIICCTPYHDLRMSTGRNRAPLYALSMSKCPVEIIHLWIFGMGVYNSSLLFQMTKLSGSVVAGRSQKAASFLCVYTVCLWYFLSWY